MEGRHEIRAAVYSPESWDQWSDIDGEWQGEDIHYGDIADFDVVHRATEGMGAIIHLTAHFPKGVDLRDPKLSVTPDGRLMLVMGGSIYDGNAYQTRAPRISFSEDRFQWTEPKKVLAEDH